MQQLFCSKGDPQILEDGVQVCSVSGELAEGGALPPRWLPGEVVMVLCWWPAAVSMSGRDLQEGYSPSIGKSTHTHQ